MWILLTISVPAIVIVPVAASVPVSVTVFVAIRYILGRLNFVVFITVSVSGYETDDFIFEHLFEHPANVRTLEPDPNF